eukprot:CAMPEP_0177768202 /NCGR_PEP_ID=MMETSP0491_2-20121128/9584_1 /TAXON_ID=63592 /ORGANISM="Tetraselmis chuii, Strain PLY429" /LENGTH=461 /DNA_ID=CAMNT_0019284971 /DNA_START=337 /DNA_END=1722 /DNA_ORIENTATION=+
MSKAVGCERAHVASSASGCCNRQQGGRRTARVTLALHLSSPAVGHGRSLRQSSSSSRARHRVRSRVRTAPPIFALLDKVGAQLHAGPKLSFQTDARVVAIADLHGDMQQAIRALRLAKVIPDDASRPEHCRWTGGTTHLVQLGDILDRGDDEISLILLLRKLEEEAEAAGGAIHFINGNHEVLNVACDFRYVTPGAFLESAEFHARLAESFGSTMALLGDQLPRGVPSAHVHPASMWRGEVAGPEYDRYMRRVELFAPGGAVAMQLAQHHAVLVVNDTLFCHGGLCRAHVEVGLNTINASMAAWMRGSLPPELEEALVHAKGDRDSLVWNRTLSRPLQRYEERMARRQVDAVLEGASEEVGSEIRRIVVGHTVQREGANSAFDGRTWRMDVGVSRGVAGAAPEVLEILPGEDPRILRFPPGEDQPVYSGRECAINPDTEFEPLACNLFDHRLLLRSELPVL